MRAETKPLCRSCEDHAGECCDSWWTCITNQLGECRMTTPYRSECGAFIGRDVCSV